MNSQTQPPIFTPRLVLHHVSSSRLITLFEDPESDVIYEGSGYSNPFRVLIDDNSPLRWRVPQVKNNVELNKWFMRWMVLKATNEIIGSISFHGAPNADGMIEIGLGVHPNFQHQGYAQEALEGMWGWVVEEPEVKVLRYTVSATNLASMKLVDRFGFTHVGVQNHEEDGPEETFEMSAAEFQVRHGANWRGP